MLSKNIEKEMESERDFKQRESLQEFKNYLNQTFNVGEAEDRKRSCGKS